MKFNPPPGWPHLPEGWRPPDGWRPDESWPAVPHGWKLWLDEDPKTSVTSSAREATPSLRRQSVIGRTLLRNTIFAAVASIIGPLGLQNVAKSGSSFSGVVTGVLAAFIFFWCLRIPAALLELYVTRSHSRRWITWPHGIAMVIAIVAIAGNEQHPGRNPMFHRVLSIQAATVGLLYYLILALALLILVSFTILIVNVATAHRRGTAGSAHASSSPMPDVAREHRVRTYIARLYRTPSRDAAVLGISIITAIASLIQGLDIHDIGRTVLALAAGAAGLYALVKLPNVQPNRKEQAQEAKAIGKHRDSYPLDFRGNSRTERES
jgi:hypothetical protein